MSRSHPLARALVLLPTLGVLALGCATTPVRAPRAEVLWPSATAARARLASVFPDPDAPPPKVSTWRRVFRFLVGSDADAPRHPLARPFGVAASGDVLWVSDPDLPAVLKVTGGAAERVSCPAQPWGAPMAVAVADDGTAFVADGGAGRVVAIAAGGGCRALGEGALDRPVAVALDGDRLLVADPPRHQIVVLASSGEVLARWGSLGDGAGQLHFPTGVARAPDGTVLVVDAMNFRIVRLSAAGEWLAAFGTSGEEGAALASPKAVATDPSGRVFVTDARRDVVLVFGATGELDYTIGETGSAPGHLAHPAGVAVVGRRVLVADSMNRRVQVFEILGDPS